MIFSKKKHTCSHPVVTDCMSDFLKSIDGILYINWEHQMGVMDELHIKINKLKVELKNITELNEINECRIGQQNKLLEAYRNKENEK